MSENLQESDCDQPELESMLLSVDSRAKMLALQVSKLVSSVKTGVLPEAGYGVKCAELLAKLSPNGLWLKMYGTCSQSLLWDFSGGGSELFSKTWTDWGIVQDGRVTALEMLGQSITETGYSLLPTPGASDGSAWKKINKNDFHFSVWKIVLGGHQNKTLYPLILKGFTINRIAESYEMIMGFPQGWTDLDV
jgi:hypothetical protein